MTQGWMGQFIVVVETPALEKIIRTGRFPTINGARIVPEPGIKSLNPGGSNHPVKLVNSVN